MTASSQQQRLDLSIYLITKPAYTAGEDYFRILEQALKGGVSLLQFREKKGDTGELFHLAQAVQNLAKAYQTPFIVNDRVDLALALDAEGVHVGQDDLPATVARRLLGPDKILGVSAGSLEEAIQAERDGADYLGVGSVYPTGTKKDAKPISMDVFRAICQKVSIPVVAIGGIRHEKVPSLLENGASGVAVISAVWDHVDPTIAVDHLKSVMVKKGR